MKPKTEVSELISTLKEHNRQRRCYMTSRQMISNRLTMTVATMHGYNGGMKEGERTKRFNEATKLIARVVGGASISDTDGPFADLILATMPSIKAFNHELADVEKAMVALAKQLPIYPWICLPDQRGFGESSLAIIVGDAGDLSIYSNPGKLWKRMGCAPYEKNGKMQMPSTWRTSKPGLKADEWLDIGYSPRRRSDMWNIEEALIKGNQSKDKVPGPYRARYLQAKVVMEEKHPEYAVCKKCKGTGKKEKGGKCDNCKDGRVTMHYHNHGHLLCGKLLLKNLWIAWTGGMEDKETIR